MPLLMLSGGSACCMQVNQETPSALSCGMSSAIGIHPLPGMFLNVRAAAGTYTKGQPVAVANGRVTAVVADAVVPEEASRASGEGCKITGD